jgi:hypothetical protein
MLLVGFSGVGVHGVAPSSPARLGDDFLHVKICFQNPEFVLCAFLLTGSEPIGSLMRNGRRRRSFAQLNRRVGAEGNFFLFSL